MEQLIPTELVLIFSTIFLISEVWSYRYHRLRLRGTFEINQENEDNDELKIEYIKYNQYYAGLGLLYS